MPTFWRRCARHHVLFKPPEHCPACEASSRRARDARRPGPRRRGYTAQYDRLRRQVLQRDGYTCQYCGAPATTADHHVPLAQGGETTLENLVAACSRCNFSRVRRSR